MRRIKRFLSRFFPSLRLKSYGLEKFIDSKKSSSHTLIRLGTQYGGWIIPDGILSKDSVAYLAGAGEDISFDCELVVKYSCTAIIIDPTPRARIHFDTLVDTVKRGNRFAINKSQTDFYQVDANHLSRITFIPFGLSNRDEVLKFYYPKNPDHVSCSTVNLQGTDIYFQAKCYRLRTIMQQELHSEIDLLKMDIEGGEYTVIKDMVESRILPKILLIEFDENHTPMDNKAKTRIRESITRLIESGMACIAVEGSNVTFIRNDVLAAQSAN
jgi:FkbM family methyltransferase